jgi:copper chaperone CopZ
MKKVIETEGMCCKRCAERVEKKLRLLEGVAGAKANYKKGIVFVESNLPDEALVSCVAEAGLGVKLIRPRKGIFG